MKPSQEVIDLINSMRNFHIPQGRSQIRPFAEKRIHHRKPRWCVGYSWSRMYSHHMSGKVYDCIVGYGDTLEAAIAKAKAKLEATCKIQT